MNLRAIWSFIAGDSRFAPALVAVAIGAALLLIRFAGLDTTYAGVVFFALIVVALVGSVFERV